MLVGSGSDASILIATDAFGSRASSPIALGSSALGGLAQGFMNLFVRADAIGQCVAPLWNNANRLKKIIYRLGPYMRFLLHAARRGVPLTALARTQFPFLFSDASAPPCVHVGFTSACNLRCVYCRNPGLPYPRSFISTEVFNAVILSLRELSVPRVVVGGGEPTLHPEFGAMARELRRATRFLQIVTNGQWRQPEIGEVLLTTPFDRIEVSVDAGGREYYEKSRRGGSYALLVDNLTQLRKRRDALRASSRINIRLMIRPSIAAQAQDYSRFWSPYADSVMRQYVLHAAGTQYFDDVYMSHHSVNDAYPKCSIPFKVIPVSPTGNVRLCTMSGLLLGNILTSSLKEMWLGDTMRRYRYGHRTRELAEIPLCKGCVGC